MSPHKKIYVFMARLCQLVNVGRTHKPNRDKTPALSGAPQKKVFVLEFIRNLQKNLIQQFEKLQKLN